MNVDSIHFLLRFLLPAILTAPLASAINPSAPPSPPNILFIAIDDLRNDLGALGVAHAKTPNLDQFAQTGRLFSRHYTLVPTCGPSRAALLSGRQPTQQAHIRNNAIAKTHQPWVHQSLPAWFRNHGYQTLALGKISHYPGGLTGRNWAEGPEELPDAWDRSWVPEGPWESPLAMMHGYANGKPRELGKSPAWEAFDGPDTAYPDAWVAQEAIQVLEELAEQKTPWFFAIGFFKPHLPFAAPKHWFDLHDPANIPPPPHAEKPSTPSSWHPSSETLRNYGDHQARDPRHDESYASELRHAYAASTSYVDAQVGRVLDRLQSLDLADRTIVVIWSDHGFCLGEHGTWGKHSLYEESLKSPLIIRYPGLPEPGRISHATVETIDIFPTLTDLSGLAQPAGLQGKSLRPQLDQADAPSSKPAMAWFQRGQLSIRDDHWRLIAHRPGDEENGLELFDFRHHPHGRRADPDEHPQITQDLLRQLEGVPFF